MTRSVFLLRDTSIVEIFSSEKTTSPVCVPFCILSSKNLTSLLPLWRLLLCKMVALEEVKEGHL